MSNSLIIDVRKDGRQFSDFDVMLLIGGRFVAAVERGWMHQIAYIMPTKLLVSGSCDLNC